MRVLTQGSGGEDGELGATENPLPSYPPPPPPSEQLVKASTRAHMHTRTHAHMQVHARAHARTRMQAHTVAFLYVRPKMWLGCMVRVLVCTLIGMQAEERVAALEAELAELHSRAADVAETVRTRRATYMHLGPHMHVCFFAT